LSHRARVTEEVVRAEIRKAAAARKTELPAARVPLIGGQLRAAERGLLWGLVHQPEQVMPWVRTLQDSDLEGLNSENLLRLARDLASGGASELPNRLMERLSSEEANRLAAIAAEASAPVLDAEQSVRTLKQLRLERERAEIQREIDRMQAAGRSGPELNALLTRKGELSRLLEPGRR
jgi:hypothetical protein